MSLYSKACGRRFFLPYVKKHLTSNCTSNLNQTSNYASYSVPQSAQVIVCGAGAVGNSVAYHMNKNDWKDVIVLEQSKIGSGVSWRSCGIVGHFHSTSEGRITAYSSQLYKQLSNEGHDVGYVETGSINVARTKERMIELRRLASEASVHNLKFEVLDPKDILKYHPFVKPDGLEGGIWVPSDGVVNPLSVCHALAKVAQDGGVKYYEGIKVLEILTNGTKVTGVKTNFGVINCEHLILCAGMWTRTLAINCIPPCNIPIQAAENAYAITRPVPGLTSTTPILRDYDAGVYVREFNSGFMIGGFPKQARPLFCEKVPEEFSFQDLSSDWEYFKPVYEEACFRVPILNQVDIQKYTSGPDTFTPDGHWILGETAEIDNLYVVVGMNVNAVQPAGGLGKELADWITTGEPKAYLLPFDVRRFVDAHNNKKFLEERVKEAVGFNYSIRHPLLIEFSKARKARCSPLYTVQEKAGAVFGERMGFERVLYFDPSLSKEERLKPPAIVFEKPSWFENVKEEYTACRERVGIIDMSSFTKFHLKSGGREVVDLLQLLCSNDIDVPVGNIVSSGMQNDKGCYENDCLLLRRAHNCYFMMSPTAQQTRITEWMKRHLPKDGSISLRDVTSMYTVLNIVGPKSKELMCELTRTEMDLPGFTCKKINVGYAGEVLVMAFNNTGEPGYSLYIPSEYALHVYNNLLTAGRDYGIRNVGYYALRFLRIEKFIPFWAEELDSHTTPFEVGRGFKVKMQNSTEPAADFEEINTSTVLVNAGTQTNKTYRSVGVQVGSSCFSNVCKEVQTNDLSEAASDSDSEISAAVENSSDDFCSGDSLVAEENSGD
ncbi:LOW QUALITY PROTEIN: pyruvate dehydrogenase phosphatase regulatory subunit, mitochondrial-like [Uloborus diversus]|uniref:LOW QUALITY PROTEIN: pyruvate dehydrogenase phosphatase regulatory subunit, mitochondrial-like n=1 Tax=Uloborus diversus TaxID=327109 RepID=UPI00240A7C28|nr:LOW QUALITY PROTEIN: pyruvate dehydrogenase phosphatase regulatory subunit, mitochondrial-like [Uloborus diversus]